MATLDHPISGVSETRTRQKGFPLGSVRFDLIVTLLSVWFAIGLYFDGWAHNHGRVDDTFFTPYHAILYSGYAAIGAFLVFNHFRNVSRGYAWTKALPKGYTLSLIGVAIFGVAGVVDMLWHEAFGFEENLEQLLSPSHLALASGAFLFMTGPVRAAWRRKNAAGWANLFPAILALTLILSLFTFFTMYASPYERAGDLIGFRPNRFFEVDQYGITSALIYNTLLLGMLMFAMRRWKLPVGTVTFMVTINTAAMFWLHMPDDSAYRVQLLIIPVIGILGDGLLYFTRPGEDHPLALRAFGFLLPFVYMLTYLFLLTQVGETLFDRGLWWKIHMWLGVPFSAGIAGLFMTYLVVPPAIAYETDDEAA